MVPRHDHPRRLRTPAARSVPVSVVVPVKNEAENLRRCLPALAWADEVFVVDSQSTDRTSEVAAEHGATVVPFHFNGTYPKKNWALENLPFRNEWVLIVDADRGRCARLAVEIERRIARDEAEGYYLNSRISFSAVGSATAGIPNAGICGSSSTAWALRADARPTTWSAGDNEAHEHVELEGGCSDWTRAGSPRLPDDRRLGREAQPLCHLGGRAATSDSSMSRYQGHRAGQAVQTPAEKMRLRLPMRPRSDSCTPTSSAWASSMGGLAWSFAASWPSMIFWLRPITTSGGWPITTGGVQNNPHSTRRNRKVPGSPARPVEGGSPTLVSSRRAMKWMC